MVDLADLPAARLRWILMIFGLLVSGSVGASEASAQKVHIAEPHSNSHDPAPHRLSESAFGVIPPKKTNSSKPFVIGKLRGEVSYFRGKRWRKITKEMRVGTGMILQTGPTARASLFIQGGEVSLSPGTVLSVKRSSFRKPILSLDAGHLHVLGDSKTSMNLVIHLPQGHFGLQKGESILSVTESEKAFAQDLTGTFRMAPDWKTRRKLKTSQQTFVQVAVLSGLGKLVWREARKRQKSLIRAGELFKFYGRTTGVFPEPVGEAPLRQLARSLF